METVGRRSTDKKGERKTSEENDEVFDVADSHELSLVLNEQRHAGCVDNVRAKVEDSIPEDETEGKRAPDELGDLQGKDVDEQTKEPVEGDIREGNVTIREMVCEFGQLLRKKVCKDALVHAHSKLRERSEIRIRVHL